MIAVRSGKLSGWYAGVGAVAIVAAIGLVPGIGPDSERGVIKRNTWEPAVLRILAAASEADRGRGRKGLDAKAVEGMEWMCAPVPPPCM